MRRSVVEIAQICDLILAEIPVQPAALGIKATIQSDLFDDRIAIANLLETLVEQPNLIDAKYHMALLAGSTGQHQIAITLLDQVLLCRADDAAAWNSRGIALAKLARYDEAIESYDRALSYAPDLFSTYYNRGNALRLTRQFQKALLDYERVLALQPGHSGALNNRGLTLACLKRDEDALESFDLALAGSPNDVVVLRNRALSLASLNRHEEALVALERAIVIKPDYAAALYDRGVTLAKLDRYEEAILNYDRAIAIKDDEKAWHARGLALVRLNRLLEAITSYDHALRIAPTWKETYNSKALALTKLSRFAEAHSTYEKALSIAPDYAEAYYNRGHLFKLQKQFEPALQDFRKALAINPNIPFALGSVVETQLAACDWRELSLSIQTIFSRLLDEDFVISPFTLITLPSSASQQLVAARQYMKKTIAARNTLVQIKPTSRPDRIRVAYLSSDFRDHPVASLTAELFERHDRNKFEVIGISYGPDDRSPMRARLKKAFDSFYDVKNYEDYAAAKQLRDLNVAIAVDLNGHTHGARPGILAYRPAPVQVSYLGYAGTTGNDSIDYLIADPIVAPFSDAPFYSEKIAHLPACFLAQDTTKPISPFTPSRSDSNLPEGAFVFCCFNNSYKLGPDLFAVWMRLLNRVEGSVLWLSAHDSTAMSTLRREAAERGIDPRRLVFAPRTKALEDHLARHRLADLFLDTLPFSAHTTASDALWTGLPVLTVTGTTFAGRVATSLLSAVGLPELAVKNVGEYEATAIALATNRPRLAAIRQQLQTQKASNILFDSNKFCRNLEGAYATMYDIWRRNEMPRSFSVE